jgi:hypothetical protein
MAIDTSIYNNVRPFTMADPYESAGKALALRAMQKKYTIEDDIAQAGAETGGDPTRMAQALLAKGHYEPALKLQAQAAALRKEQAGVLQAEQSRFASLLPVLRNELARVGDDAGLAQLRMKTATLAQGFTSPQFQQMLTSMAQEIPERFDRNWQQQQLMTADDLLKRLTPEIRYTDTGGALTPIQTNPNAPGGLGVVPGAQSIQKTVAPQAPTELARYLAERAAIAQQNPNDPRLPQYDKVIAGFKAGRSTDITLSQGPMETGKAGGNKVDEDLLGVTRGLMQLDQIQSQFKPEFQQYMDKAGFAALAVKEKAGFKLTNKQQKDLTEFASYRRNAVNSLNEYIKQITGAAMSEPEARRILSGMPKPGDGIFDGDSPTEFKAKLDDAMQKTKMAVARLAYIKRNGMSLEDGSGNPVIALERMPQLINERGRAIENELKKTGASGKPLERAVRRQLGVEFGLVSD